jgi:hypothetical protein
MGDRAQSSRQTDQSIAYLKRRFEACRQKRINAMVARLPDNGRLLINLLREHTNSASASMKSWVTPLRRSPT